MDNLPPKRIKKADTKDIFPQIGIDNDEQRRLAKIAGSISGLANQLAEKQRQNRQSSQERVGNLTMDQPGTGEWSHMVEEQKFE